MEQDVSAKSAFQWDDPLLLEGQLGEEEKMIRDTARAYAQDRLAPRIREAYANEHTDRAIFNEMGELGLLGATLPEQYGGVGASYVSYGLVAREIERVDSGYRSMASVQSSLVMVPIYEFGTEGQKQKFLPKLSEPFAHGRIGQRIGNRQEIGGRGAHERSEAGQNCD